MASTGTASIADDIDLLDRKLKQLKLEYDQYFLGSRPREPHLLRGEVQKLVAIYSNQPIQNTALRFRFNNLCARFFSLRRRWDANQRQIEDGTYERHVFKARLHEHARAAEPAAARGEGARPGSAEEGVDEVFRAYVAARRECGEDVSSLTRERLAGLLERQEQEIRARYGCERVRFRVVVEGGRAKLKATAVRGSEASGS